MMMSMIDALSPLALLYESENWLSFFLFFIKKTPGERKERSEERPGAKTGCVTNASGKFRPISKHACNKAKKTRRIHDTRYNKRKQAPIT